MTTIFVFGSNLAGIHGAGSALAAHRYWGAKWGIGEGPTGKAYAIPTKNEQLETLSLVDINRAIHRFLIYARTHPEDTFRVVKVGCGLAGYAQNDIIPMFTGAPDNVVLPVGWEK